MDMERFIARHGLSPDSIDGPGCLQRLLREMDLGLAGEGNIPMIPSYLSLDTRPVPEEPCCVLDAGGTNLRIARAVFEKNGGCILEGLEKTAMPGTQGELSAEKFYEILANYAKATGAAERVGFCFSYNVLQDRTLDGILHSWCKEVRVPDAPGRPVGASLRQAIGERCEHITVLNDSTAALLGAHGQDPEITLGLILGTGINICYSEKCRNIPKVPADLRQETMIVSTEIGEFDGFPKSTFDVSVIEGSDEPAMAHAEKQCAGAYLGGIISLAWQAAAGEGLLEEAFLAPVDLPRISAYLAGEDVGLPESPAAKLLAETVLHRAAKIAAVLAAGPTVKSCAPGSRCRMVIEGSQFEKLTGFAGFFCRELEALLQPREIAFSVAKVENSCLLGAAIAAFAEPM